MTLLSSHFSYEELTFSQTALRLGLDNTPNEEQRSNLVHLANTGLEIAREILGTALHIDSGYRSSSVNHAVGSTAGHSAHLDGLAADFRPWGVDLKVAFYLLRTSPLLLYDRIILECDAWIHLAVSPLGKSPARIALRASGKPGDWTYSRVTGE